jgi:hypothetical protein
MQDLPRKHEHSRIRFFLAKVKPSPAKMSTCFPDEQEMESNEYRSMKWANTKALSEKISRNGPMLVYKAKKAINKSMATMMEGAPAMAALQTQLTLAVPAGHPRLAAEGAAGHTVYVWARVIWYWHVPLVAELPHQMQHSPLSLSLSLQAVPTPPQTARVETKKEERTRATSNNFIIFFRRCERQFE